MKQALSTLLRCPHCSASLEYIGSCLTCTSCGNTVPCKQGAIDFVGESKFVSCEGQDDFVLRLKNWFKKRPGLFSLFYNTVGIFVGKTARQFVSELQPDAVVLNIGSGIKSVTPQVINVDYESWVGVDVIASAYELPFRDSSVDAIITESLLEHLENPERAVSEMFRVLKTNGRIYVVTPFMLGFHSSPNDFYRWTIPGMKLLLSDFDIYNSGVAAGPTSAMVAILREWCAMLLSFGNRSLYQLLTLFFMILFIPLNLFDYILSRFDFSSTIALLYYWEGRKK